MTWPEMKNEEGTGVATQSCPMGWQPSLDHFLHASYLAGAIADVWLLRPKKRKLSRAVRALRKAEIMINVQIDDAVIHSLWGPKYVCQRNASADILSFTPAEWKRSHESYLVQGGFMNLIQPGCFTFHPSRCSKDSGCLIINAVN